MQVDKRFETDSQVDAASEAEPSLHELLAELVARTGDNGALLRRIHRQLEQQGDGTGAPQAWLQAQLVGRRESEQSQHR